VSAYIFEATYHKTMLSEYGTGIFNPFNIDAF